MFEFLTDIWESVLNFFGFIAFYFQNFVDYIDDGIRLILKYGTYLTFWLGEQAIIVAYEITSEFLESFDYTNRVNSAWSAIPSTPRQILTFLRVPECLNIIIASLGTRFTLKFVPFV